jgi:hypothetical protein
MEINKLVITSILILGNIPIIGHAKLNSKDIQECYGETKPYIEIDPIPPQTVNNTFPVKAHMSKEVRKLYPNQDVAISIVLQANPKYFNVYGHPQDSVEIISDQGGEWEWRIQALEPRKHPLDLSVGIVKIGPQNSLIIEDNCIESTAVEVQKLSFISRFGIGIANNLSLLISNFVTIVIAAVGWWIALKKGKKK